MRAQAYFDHTKEAEDSSFLCVPKSVIALIFCRTTVQLRQFLIYTTSRL